MLEQALSPKSAAATRPFALARGRLARWRDNLAKDPWVDECVDILADMK